MRKGSDLKIHIRLAAHSLGRKVVTKGKTIEQLKTTLADLRREQTERGGILRTNQRSNP